MPTQTYTLSVRMSPEVRDQLRALAKADMRKPVDWVRVAIQRAYAERFGTDEPPKDDK